MIDLHSHILYDIDDGARTREESLEMGRRAAADGTRIIAATSHSPYSSASLNYSPDLLRERCAELNGTFQAEGVLLEVITGTEIAYTSSILNQLQRGKLLTYGKSRAILVEFASNSMPHGFEVTFFNLQVAGYRIVLAHPERIMEVQHDPNTLLPLIERGVLMQITAEALTGNQSGRRRSTAETLLTHGFAHLLASDSHGLEPRRPPILSRARARAAELVGEAAADAMVNGVPHALVFDEPLALVTPKPVRSR